VAMSAQILWDSLARKTYASCHPYSNSSDDLSGTVINFHPTCAVGEYPHSSLVGSFAPNDYGLYTMVGNRWEWSDRESQ
jgi:formylglycine-generating enzyme required for sulfatase activity